MQVIAGASYGGAETFFERLVPALARAGIDQRVVIRRDAARSARLRASGIDPVELSFGGMLDMTTRRALDTEAAGFQPDLVLAWMSRAARFSPTGAHVLAGRLGGYYDLKYYRRCDHLIGNTPQIRDYLVEHGWPSDRAWYLPNFVDAIPAAPIPRQTFDTPDGVPLLLALGRLHANKAFDVLLTALGALPGVHLWLAGEGPLRPALERQTHQLGIAGRVRFLGWRSDVPALLAAADILVCPSRHEPLGNVIIEGWAHHTPVVAAAADGPAALIEHGRTGMLAPIDDADALGAAILRVVREKALAAELAAGGHAAYASRFTEASVVAQYAAFFEKVRH